MHGSYQWKECNEFGDAIIRKSNVKTVAHKPTCRKASIEATTNNRFCQIVHLEPPRTVRRQLVVPPDAVAEQATRLGDLAGLRRPRAVVGDEHLGHETPTPPLTRGIN